MDESADNSTSKSGGFLSRMRAQTAARAADNTRQPLAIPRTPSPASPPATGLRVEAIAMTMAAHEPSPEPPLERPPSPFVPMQAPNPAPAVIAPTSLEPVSDLSEIEPEEAPEIPASKKKSSVPKGKRKGAGQGSEGGPSKRRSGRKKTGNNA